MVRCYLSRFKQALTCLMLALPLWSGAQSGVNLPARIELHAIQSTTLTGDEFLQGGQQGKSAMLAGELRLPVGTSTKYPVVVLVHGSGGVSGSMDMWLHQLNQAGIATFVLDTFSGRGIVSTVQDQTQLHSLAMMVDAYRALDLLAKHPRIDAKKISVMGFSKGAVASIFSASTRFKTMYGSSAQFAAHIGLYTPCNTRYLGDTQLTGAPMRFFHGTTDDYVNVAPCRSYVQTLKQQGMDVSLTEFPDTEHGYDSPLAPKRLAVPSAQSTRNCYFTEKTPAQLVNEKTGAPFSYTDACVAVGAHVGHNPESTAQTVKAVIEFLKSL
jgi:dienelactone hydrolase